MSRKSPNSISTPIQWGSIAVGNDKNIWYREKRSDGVLYWEEFSNIEEWKSIFLTLENYQSDEYKYGGISFTWTDSNGLGVFRILYINQGEIIAFDILNNASLPPVVLRSNTDFYTYQFKLKSYKNLIFKHFDNFDFHNQIDFLPEMRRDINQIFNVLDNRYENLKVSWDKADEEPEPMPQPEEFKPIWRFKTKQEFIDEFGDEWQNKAQWNLSGRMDYLFGKLITKPNFDPSAFDRKDINTQVEFGIASGENNDWTIFPQMFKKIESEDFKPIWRFKTEQEFIDEFGDSWNSKINWLRGANNMDYLFGQPVTKPNFDANEFNEFERLNTKLDLGIDSGGDNTWSVIDKMFKKIENDQSNNMIGKLLLKGNFDTYLKISENLDRLEINSDEFVWIKPSMYYDNEFFQFLSTDLAREEYDIICKIRLDYEFGVTITFQDPSSDIDFIARKITSESKFVNAIADVEKYINNLGFLQELNVIALLLQNGIWRDRSIVCDFVSSTPKPKFAVGDKVTKKNNKKRIFTITSITAFDDEQQQWDYDVVEDIDGNQLSYWENELELAPIEEPSPTECNVDVSLIDSEYVGKFYQANKNRIEALNSNISCLFLEALLSLSNYEKCGDGVEIPMPQPKKEVKEDLLAQIRNLKI
jgi:hypothetical protein